MSTNQDRKTCKPQRRKIIRREFGTALAGTTMMSSDPYIHAATRGDHLGQVFEAFRQVDDSSTRSQEGTGLRLTQRYD